MPELPVAPTPPIAPTPPVFQPPVITPPTPPSAQPFYEQRQQLIQQLDVLKQGLFQKKQALINQGQMMRQQIPRWTFKNGEWFFGDRKML